MSNNASDQNVCVVTTPSPEPSFAEPIFRFGRILSHSVGELSLIAGVQIGPNQRGKYDRTIPVGDGDYVSYAPIDFLLLQIHISFLLIQVRSSTDIVYFHKGAMGMALPVLIARLMGMKTCVIKIGAFATERSADPGFLDYILFKLQWTSFYLAHAGVVFTDSERETVPNSKVHVSFSNYRDPDQFNKSTPLDQRTVDFGFIGRFDEVKGVCKAAKAATTLVEQNPDITVRFVGDGPMYPQVASLVEEYENIELTGWVAHDELVKHYNEIKVLIFPSRAEGLPTTLIEAMGCGVVVAATPVGGVKDLIRNGSTGFIISPATPEGIVDVCEQAMSKSLERISKNSRILVCENYTEDAARKRFKEITEDLSTDR